MEFKDSADAGCAYCVYRMNAAQTESKTMFMLLWLPWRLRHCEMPAAEHAQ